MKGGCLIKFAIGISLFSCHATDGNGYSKVVTNRRLNSIEVIFTDIGVGSYSPKFNILPGRIELVRGVVKDRVIPSDVFVDGWGHDYRCLANNGWLYIWSVGKNGIDNNMKRDDIFRQIKFYCNGR